MTTFFLLVSVLLALACFARQVTLVIVAFLVLRDSPPEKRSEILRALPAPRATRDAVFGPARQGLDPAGSKTGGVWGAITRI
ncbi:hypothetical protein [Actinophytocola sediminis]